LHLQRGGAWGFSELSKGLPWSELLYWTSIEAVLFAPPLLAILLLRRARTPAGAA